MFQHLGNTGSASGDARVDALIAQVSTALARLDAAEQALAAVPPPSDAPPARPAPDHSALYTAVAELQELTDTLKTRLGDLHIPDLAPVITRMGDLDTRIRFAERALQSLPKSVDYGPALKDMSAALVNIRARVSQDAEGLRASLESHRATISHLQAQLLQHSWRWKAAMITAVTAFVGLAAYVAYTL